MEARRGEGFTRPNPPVGAVLVKNGKCIGKGYHHAAGQPHAEVEAFEDAKANGADVIGATLYVTLEPCSTQGRTPPCTDRILREGVKRVVIGCLDMNPKHAGRGVGVLRDAGIEVDVVDNQIINTLIAPFHKWITTGLPFITLKMAQSQDGFIGVVGKRVMISGEKSLARVQDMRRRADAVMVGVGTVLADNPRLLCRKKTARKQQLWRVIVDTWGRTPLESTVCTDDAKGRTVIAVTAKCPAKRRREFEKAGVSVWTLPQRKGHVSLPALVKRMGQEGWLHVLCEGGGELAGALVRDGLVDELHLVTSPRKLGKGVRTFGTEKKDVEGKFKWGKSEKVGKDVWRVGIGTM